jgi:hypothetical protein
MIDVKFLEMTLPYLGFTLVKKVRSTSNTISMTEVNFTAKIILIQSVQVTMLPMTVQGETCTGDK